MEFKPVQPITSASTQQINSLIIDALQDIKAKDIVQLDLRKLEERPADFFIICSGESSTQIHAIAGNVYKRLKEEIELLPGHFEGRQSVLWVLVDYFETVVHIFYPETREFYDIEELWNDAEITRFDED